MMMETPDGLDEREGKKVYVLELERSEREGNDKGGVIACCRRLKIGLKQKT